MGENLVSFETNDKIGEYFSKEGLNGIKNSYACSKDNIYFLLHRKYITTQELKKSTEKDEYEFLYKKKMKQRRMKTKALLNLIKIFYFVKLFSKEVHHKCTFKDYRSRYIHSFEYRCVYEIKYTKMDKKEEHILKITLYYM